MTTVKNELTIEKELTKNAVKLEDFDGRFFILFSICLNIKFYFEWIYLLIQVKCITIENDFFIIICPQVSKVVQCSPRVLKM